MPKDRPFRRALTRAALLSLLAIVVWLYGQSTQAKWGTAGDNVPIHTTTPGSTPTAP